MPHRHQALQGARNRLDEIDRQILDLLTERNAIVQEVVATKVENQLPIFVAARESEKVQAFREQARERGMNEEWAEDFLRMIMGASRASQSSSRFPRATSEPKHVLLVGGRGGMGSLYARVLQRSGHEVHVIDRDDWDRLPTIAPLLDLAIVTVPIHVTGDVIARLAPGLRPQTVLADFTSNKQGPLQAMLDAHSGPVVGLHPMHGPDVQNLSKQLLVVCPGRAPEQADWFLQQCTLWGLRLIEADPVQHDHVMHLVQGLRHFLALLHGSFMQTYDLKPEDILAFSSPIYRAELMMTGRIFAQDARLYADIVFSTEERRALLLQFFEHHAQLAELVKSGDKEGFIREFEAIAAFFGDFAPQALYESGYLINRLADRFA